MHISQQTTLYELRQNLLQIVHRDWLLNDRIDWNRQIGQRTSRQQHQLGVNPLFS